jgi:hypothetical protein
LVIVDEGNQNVIFYPSKPSSIFLDIEGIKVLEEQTELLVPSDKTGDDQLLSGFFYAWNLGEMNLQVTIFGYEREESQKVIDSMMPRIW